MLNKNNERELAYVVIIDDITPIDGYDRVELAHVGGWTIVVGKGEFKKGDPAIYFEIDSKLPEVKPFTDMEFLTKKHYKIKTQKMCKSISQGLLMSAKNFGWSNGIDGNRVFIDDSDGTSHYADDESRFLTAKLGITYAVTEDNYRKSNKGVDKYSKMAKRHGKLFSKMPFRWLMRREWGRKLLFIFFGKKKDSRGFPSWVVKTDEERCLIPQTKILTDRGRISIGKIVNNKMDVRVASVNADGSISYKRILDYQKFDNNYQDVITIGYPYSVGVNGRKNHLCCTPDHKLLTQRGYIEAKNLSMEDHLFMPSNCFGDDCLGALYGMIIGDGHIYNDKRSDGNLRFVATNGEDQIDYLKYKMSLFDNDGKIIDAGSSPYSGKRIYHWFISADGNITNKMRDEIYIDGKKTVTRKVVNRLNDVGLALWYMDDGCLTYRNKEKQNPFIRLNTQALSKEENDLLCEFLSSKYRIKCHVCEDNTNDGRTYYYIRISASSTEDFLEIVTPYMCKSMAYKTIPSLENMIGTKTVLYKKEQRVIEIPINSIQYGQHKNITIPKKFPYVYDIEVEDNHNFIADGVVVHNCQNMPWILKDKEPFIATEKVDGTSTTFTLKRGTGLFANDEFYVCSRNVCFDKPDATCFYDRNVYIEMAEKYGIEDRMRELLHDKLPDCEWITIQGETYGGGIQKRDYSIKEHNFMAFNFITSQDGRWNTLEMKDLLEEYGIPCVPVIDGSYILPDTVDELLEYAAGKSVIDGGMREGIVFRSLDGKKSFKAVSNEYLMKFHQ